MAVDRHAEPRAEISRDLVLADADKEVNGSLLLCREGEGDGGIGAQEADVGVAAGGGTAGADGVLYYLWPQDIAQSPFLLRLPSYTKWNPYIPDKDCLSNQFLIILYNP